MVSCHVVIFAIWSFLFFAYCFIYFLFSVVQKIISCRKLIMIQFKLNVYFGFKIYMINFYLLFILLFLFQVLYLLKNMKTLITYFVLSGEWWGKYYLKWVHPLLTYCSIYKKSNIYSVFKDSMPKSHIWNTHQGSTFLTMQLAKRGVEKSPTVLSYCYFIKI